MVFYLEADFLLHLRTPVVPLVLLCLDLLLRDHHPVLLNLLLSLLLFLNSNLVAIEEHHASARTEMPVFGWVRSKLTLLRVNQATVSAVLSVVEFRGQEALSVAKSRFAD